MADVPRVAFTLLQAWHRVPGGTASSALRLAAALDASGEIEVCGVGPRGRDLPAAPWTPPVPVARMSLPAPALYEVWHRWRRLPVQRATGPVDLVHATSPMVPPSGGVPLVVTVHDLVPWTDPERLTPRGARLMSRGLELARDTASAVLCPSDAIAAAAVAAGFDRHRMRVTRWGPTFAPPAPGETDDVLARHRLERDGYVVAVGTVEPRKNLRTLIRAAIEWNNPATPLVVVGPEGWSEDLVPLIEQAGPRVRRVGFVSDTDLAGLCDGALALCCPSLSEGFGMPVLDAMSVGTPVVTSKDPALREVAGDSGIAIDALDVDGWADALERLASDSVLRARYGAAGRARSAEFTWSAAAAATLEAYRMVLR